MTTPTNEDVKFILMHWNYDPNKSRVFYDTLRAILDDPTHPAWGDEELVCWVVDRAWRGDYHYVPSRGVARSATRW